MKFYLLEADGSTTELPPSEDFHFYGSPSTGLYYFDGETLVEINPAVASKIDKKRLESDFPMSDRDKEELKARIKKIKSDISSGDLLDKIETERVFYGSDEAEDDTPTRPVPTSKQELVINSIMDFVSDQIGINYDWGYGKDSPMSLSPDILKKVRKRHVEPKDIEIGLYFDRSGSWHGAYESNFGKDIVAALKVFEDDEELNDMGIHVHTNVYYFAVHVWPEEETALNEVNNGGEPIIQHMIATQPTNVIIMTDSDMDVPDDQRWWPSKKKSYMKSKYIAPGGVWGIFIGNPAETLIKGFGSTEWHLAGEEYTQVFNLYRGEV